MTSDSPVPGHLIIRQGDAAIVDKKVNRFKRGDLVLIEIPTGKNSIFTVRRISGVGGDSISSSMHVSNHFGKIPSGFYYLLGDSTNALDSRRLGLFSADQLHGKVVLVLK